MKGDGFDAVFDVSAGTFSSIELNGINILKAGGGPMPHFWRAAHRNDDVYADRSWANAGLKDLKWTVKDVSSEQVSPSEAKVAVKMTGEGKNGYTVDFNAVYTISGSGNITAENSISSSNPDQVAGRIGVRLFLDKQFENAEYFGRGPMENYADRKRGFDVGVYKSTVRELMTPYEKPMDAGNHEDVRWLKITRAGGTGIKAFSNSTLLQFTALPYSDEQMDPVEYRIDLPQSDATVLCLSYRTLGVGTASCGPRPLPQYMVYTAPATFSYTLQLMP